uniref:DUF2474 domain-containing protein n=1 Tax=Dulem virus 35 TaxID=3145753 RepID=A0AAU8B291_9CAUD
MRLAKIVVPVLLWLCSVWMMLTAIMAMMMGLI